MTVFLADHLSFGPFELHDLADALRLFDAVGALVCVFFMLVAKGSTWRDSRSTGRLVTVGVACVYLAWAYSELEVILLDPVGANDHDADNIDGVRVYLLTVAMLITLVGLIVRWRRATRADTETVASDRRAATDEASPTD